MLFLPVWITFFPLIISVLLYYTTHSSEKKRNALAVATSIITFLSVAALYPFIIDGNIIHFTLFEVLDSLTISFRVDILSFSLAILASFVWMLVTIYSIDYMKHEHSVNRYYVALLFTLGSCMGVFMAGDLFTLFIFLELMSLVAFVLVVREETTAALKAAYKYLIVVIIAGLSLFAAVAIVFELAGSLSLDQRGLVPEYSTLASVAFIFFLLSFGMKMGMFPVHIWLPDAHPIAPSPASALLSGIMLKTGAYGLLRVIFHVFSLEMMQETWLDTLLAVIAIITILLGSVVAITQDNLKRRLAYSSIGQMGYILLGMAILTERALIGDIFHIFSHALMKSALFLAAGAIILKTGKTSVKELAGIGWQMPYTMVCFSMAALAMIGIPPFNGFVSKWTLGIGALDAGLLFYVLVLMVSSLLSALYYLPIIISAFLGAKETSKIRINEVPYKMLIPIAVLAVSTILFGLFPTNFPYDLSRVAAKFLLTGGM